MSGIGLARGNSARRRDFVDTAVREFNPYSRDPFARWMLEFSDELFNGHGILRPSLTQNQSDRDNHRKREPEERIAPQVLYELLHGDFLHFSRKSLSTKSPSRSIPLIMNHAITIPVTMSEILVMGTPPMLHPLHQECWFARRSHRANREVRFDW